MNWKRMLAYVTGSIDEELLARNEYLVTENESCAIRSRGESGSQTGAYQLGRNGKRLGRKALDEVRRSSAQKRSLDGTGG